MANEQQSNGSTRNGSGPLPTEGPLEYITAQGERKQFTPEEMRRLHVVANREAVSSERRAATADLNRLNFTKWLIEHGKLDEFSA
jgi:hypothetical protein